MKKILLSILLLTASTLIYSQSLNLNNNKIRIVDSTMGLGITPTSRLHVFGNGTTSNLFNVTNDKDATKDSSVVIKSDGSFCSGTNTPAHLTKNTFVIKDDANIGIINTLWIDSTTTDSNRLHINEMKSLNTLNPVKGIFGIGGATYGNIYDAEFANSFFISSYSGNLHLANEMYPKMTIASNGVGIGTPTPNAALDVRDRWGASYVFKAGNDLDATLDSSTVIDYFGKVGIGISAPLHPLHVYGSGDRDNVKSEYSGSYARAAISGRASTIDAKAGSFENTASGIALDLRADNGTALRVISGDIVVNSIRFHSITTTLPDNSTYGLPTGYSWIGEIDVDSLGYTLFTAQIRCDADGTPYLEGVSWKRWSSITYVKVGSTDGYLNITDGGSGMAITNKLGYTIKATLRFRTKQ